MNETVAIIGGGTGGLFTGAILAKEGRRVTIVEKNATIGGGLQSFDRHGEHWDTGMHVVCGLTKGKSVWKICRYLGIDGRMNVKDVDDECTDELYFAEDKRRYRIRKGKEEFVKVLEEYFPEEEENLIRYINAIYKITKEVEIFDLKERQDTLIMHTGDFMMSAEDFINQYVKDRRLRSVLAYMNPLYGGEENRTPAYIHAIISALYIDGGSRFVDRSLDFAELLAKIITDAGGTIITNDAVEWIKTEGRHITGLRTKKGKEIKADTYVSDIHPTELLKIIDEKAFPKSFRERMNEIKNTYSAFALYIKLKENTFPYINHSEYYMTRYDDIWKFGEDGKQWPMGFLCMTPPVKNQGKYSRKMLITAPMKWKEVEKWEDTKVGQRGKDYEEWKERQKEKLLEKIEELHPRFKECVEDVVTSSPLTIRDYFGSKEGCLCGFSKDYKNLAMTQLPVKTKIDNLYLTGQNNNLHGLEGVALTAIDTSEAILGRNVVLRHINESL